jgi:hypothetical protein
MILFYTHDEEEIMKPIVVVSKAKATVVSKEEDSNEEYSKSKDEVAKELLVPILDNSCVNDDFSHSYIIVYEYFSLMSEMQKT